MTGVKAVEIRAELRQIKTMADFTTNIIFNVPEDCREQVKTLMDWLGDEVGVIIVSADGHANLLEGKEKANGSRPRRKRKIQEG